MPNDVIATCPVCSHELAITRLHCDHCATTLEGDFSVGRFGRLSREQLALLESFLRSRGNLRDMERELGISYPTVRNRVEALVRALGLADGDAAIVQESDQPEPAPVEGAAEAALLTKGEIAARRQEILEALAAGRIDAAAAATGIRDLGKGI
ncbi:MAG TPA: DUF2089 domain-containing protein [Candidatus Limnocylindrales bacterium]